VDFDIISVLDATLFAGVLKVGLGLVLLLLISFIFSWGASALVESNDNNGHDHHTPSDGHNKDPEWETCGWAFLFGLVEFRIVLIS
jgi:hypothetical protein